METVSTNKAHGGTQGVYRHASAATGTDMVFSVFVPDHQTGAKLPVLWYLSGLTCTHANVTEKGEYRAACAEHGVIFIAPDTSPRGEGVPDDEAYDFGQGAGFYVDATQEPWAKNFRMRSYIERELPALVAEHFPVDKRVRADRQPDQLPVGREGARRLPRERHRRLAQLRRLRADQAGRAAARAAGRPGHRGQFPRNATEDAFAGRRMPQGRYARHDQNAGRVRSFVPLHLDLRGRARRPRRAAAADPARRAARVGVRRCRSRGADRPRAQPQPRRRARRGQ